MLDVLVILLRGLTRVDRSKPSVLTWLVNIGRNIKWAVQRRRSGNLQSKPGKTDPFMRAESWLRQRKSAKIHELGAASAKSMLVRYHIPCKVAVHEQQPL